MTHDIRLALADDYPAICAYLEEHWRKGHIFARSKALFDWQHGTDDGYNFALAMREDGSIIGVLGFIPSTQFDSSSKLESLWFTIWSVADSAKGHGIGRKLLDWVENAYPATVTGTVGATAMTLPMYRARGYKTGRMHHWYAETENACRGAATMASGYDCDPVPFKSWSYFHGRYFSHPFYEYQKCVSPWDDMVVYRVARSGDVCAIRIVDLSGTPHCLRLFDWRAIATKHGAQWIDMYCAGIDSSALMGAGFKLRMGNEILIPNHFEPFEPSNIDINYAVKCKQPWRLVRGDGDMDRPNVLP